MAKVRQDPPAIQKERKVAIYRGRRARRALGRLPPWFRVGWVLGNGTKEAVQGVGVMSALGEMLRSLSLWKYI